MLENPDIAERFTADGAVCMRQAFGAEWIALAREGIERNIANPSPFFRSLADAGGGFLSDMWSRRFIPELDRFCLESPAAGLAARALRSDRVRLAQDVWFLKRPGSTERTPWHHDAVISGPFCSIWVALDPTPRAAALEFVRGSHRWGKVLMPKSFFDARRAKAEGGAASPSAADRFYADFHGDGASRADAEEFGEVPDIEADRGAYDIIGWDMAPGDCVLFDTRAVHGAPGNSSRHTIRRFVTRWVTDAAVIAPHGQDVIDALARAGFETELQVGRPISGTLFPEIVVGGR